MSELLVKAHREGNNKESIFSLEEGLIVLKQSLQLEAPEYAKRRIAIREQITQKTDIFSKRKVFLFEYVSNKYYQLKYAKTSTDIFSRTRLIVDENIRKIVPEAAQKFAFIYDNLNSENNEGWSNAVHSCRRILQEMADVIYPPRKDKETKGKPIKLGAENYINRLIAYVEEHADS